MEQEEKKEKAKKALNDYARYSGMGFQMIGTILICLFIGKKLDQWVQTKFPAFTLVFVLAGVGLSMYEIIREFTKKKN